MPTILEETAAPAIRERRQKDKEGLESVVGNPAVVKPSLIIPYGVASTSSLPTVPSTMEVGRNEFDPISPILPDSEDVDGKRHSKQPKPNPVHILNSSEDGCGDSVLGK
jgi:hypothetical protein